MCAGNSRPDSWNTTPGYASVRECHPSSTWADENPAATSVCGTRDARLHQRGQAGTCLTIGRYLPILLSMRRKSGTLLPLETEILEVALSMLRSGHATFHGFGLAQNMREKSGSRSLTAHGTLYKALGRLEEFGLVTSRWEDAAVDGRPRRRLYELTSQGAHVAERALAGEAAGRSPRLASKPT
jgi:PadR family transcriptional regulator PadR